MVCWAAKAAVVWSLKLNRGNNVIAEVSKSIPYGCRLVLVKI